MYFTYVFSINGRAFQKFCKVHLQGIWKIPNAPHTTTHRREVFASASGRYFCSLTIYQTICVGTLLIDLFLKPFLILSSIGALTENSSLLLSSKLFL